MYGRASSHARIAAPWTIRYASSRDMPASISASSSGCEKYRPCDSSMFARMRSG